MNKRHYSINEVEKQVLMKILQEVREDIINAMQKAGIFQRKRKLTSYAILFEALYRYLVESISFYQLASYMDCRHNMKLSESAWKKQLYKAIPILQKIVEEYMATHVMTTCKTKGERNIYALDATAFSIEGHNGTSTRVHSQVSLLDGLCRYDKITDEHVAESVKNFPIEAGELYLADRAYAKAQQIAWVIEHQADILFRFSPKHVVLYKNQACTKRLDVDTLLDCDRFSHICYVQYHKKVYQVRLVGKQLPEEAQAAAKKSVCKKARKNQTTIQERTLLHANWVFLLTSIRCIPSRKLFEMYRQRWQIELYFKRAKTVLNFHKAKRGSRRYAMLMTQLWSAFALLLSACQFFFSRASSSLCSHYHSFALFSLLWA